MSYHLGSSPVPTQIHRSLTLDCGLWALPVLVSASLPVLSKACTCVLSIPPPEAAVTTQCGGMSRGFGSSPCDFASAVLRSLLLLSPGPGPLLMASFSVYA